MKNKKISISFSGGRSSGAMCWLLLNDPQFKEVKKQFLFANTGQEHPATLDFVNECDKRWGLNLVWLEAQINLQKRKGTEYQQVTFETATRDKTLFEKGCIKYGLPNPTWKWCTRELKTTPMEKYRKKTGFGDALVALGMRADEIDRLSDDPLLFYPLADLGWTKQSVNQFWERQPFDLQLPNDAFGNCTWCYKKTFRKLATVAKYNPEFFETPKYLEKNYSQSGARPQGEEGTPRQIYRKHNVTQYVLDLSKDPFFREYVDPPSQMNFFFLRDLDDLDKGGACDQGCEAF